MEARACAQNAYGAAKQRDNVPATAWKNFQGAFPDSDSYVNFVCTSIAGHWIGKPCSIGSPRCKGLFPPEGRCYGVDRLFSGLSYDHPGQQLRVACAACNRWAALQEQHAAGHDVAAEF